MDSNFPPRPPARTSRRGAALVEFALVFPLIMLLTIGMIEFVRMNTLYHVADNAAYEAARHVIVPGAKKDEAIAEAERLVKAVGIRGTQFTVEPEVITEQTAQITVRVSIPLPSNSWLPPALTKQRSIGSECTLMTERVKAIQSQALDEIRSGGQDGGDNSGPPGGRNGGRPGRGQRGGRSHGS
jgi:hypothetical protein